MENYDFIHYTVKISTLNTFSFSEKKVEPKCLCTLHHCARGCGSYMFSFIMFKKKSTSNTLLIKF